MIKIDVLSSGSKGNAYVVSNGRSDILLDCGIPYKQINILSGWKKFEACLVTHEHKDHCKAVKDLVRFGTDVYMPTEMAEKLKLMEWVNVRTMDDRSEVITSEFNVKSFGLHHDVQTLGYWVKDRSTDQRLVYITDTMYCKYKFKNITHWMIECNNSTDLMDENVAKGTLNRTLRNRIAKTHMSVDTVKQMLLANDLTYTKEIWLLHLSDGNSSADDFRREIQEITGKAVYIA